MRTTDDGGGTHLPGATKWAGPVQGVPPGRAAEARRSFKTSALGEETWSYHMAFPAKRGRKS